MKKNDKTLKSAPKDSERETRVLLEDIRKQVHIVAEGHGIIIKKLDEHGRKLDEHGKKLEEHDSRFDRIENVLMDTNSRVKSIEKKFDNHETRITKLEEKVFI